METTRPTAAGDTEREDEDEEPEEPNGSTQSRPIVSSPVKTLFGSLLFVLVLGAVALLLLLLAATAVVFATGLIARWLDLPHLPLVVAVVGLLGAMGVVVAASFIGSRMAEAMKGIESSVAQAGERIADDVSASVLDLGSAFEEPPVVVHAREPMPSIRTSTHGAGTEPFRGPGDSRKRRRKP